MSAKLCEPCQRAFSSPDTSFDEYGTIGFIPFHERPWKAFQKSSNNRQDPAETVSDCDFCSFVVAFAAADEALGEYKLGFIADPDSHKRPRSSDYEPLLSSFKSSIYDDHISADIGLRRYKKADIIGLDFKLFGTADPRTDCLKPLNQTSTSTSSQESFECLSNWIEACSQNHHSCKKLHTRKNELKDWLPARLVKITSSVDGVPETIQVIETADDNYSAADINYATLSYCWGTKPFTKLLESNIETMKTVGVFVKDLPATFRDAITATSRLGLKYIWIDALCIIQQNEKDWKLHSVTMSKVYSYSAITLAAAASSDAHGGLYRDRSPTSINGVQLELKWPGLELEGQFRAVPKDPWLKAVAKSPLLRRAWVFQERLLSRGTVFFAHDMLYWECGELYASELYPNGGPWDLKYRPRHYDVADRLPPGVQPVRDYRFKHVYTGILTRDALTTDNDIGEDEMFFYVWASVVTQYSAGKLSKEGDKLIAIDGVADQMTAIAPRDRYLSGIWQESTLPLFLLWSTAPEETTPLIRVAPSWSWASVYTPVDFDFLFRAQTEPKIVITVVDIVSSTDFTSTPNSGIPGPSSAALILRGPLTEVRVRSVTRDTLGPLHSSWWGNTKFPRRYGRWRSPPLDFLPKLVFMGKGLKSDYPFVVYFDREVPRGARLFALKIAEADIRQPWTERLPSECGILLTPCTGNDQERGSFVRIGYFEIAVSRMKTDWADLATPFKSIDKLREGIWKNSGLKQDLYREWDGKDGYTIKII
ncbi:hypothetical protein FSARC_6806 [Fusarium sarcochroum]|uniref:Heterokaryon incompatibility domain-containing protein n=1 Tax=Fusarium sarcochroum TaxID=1208366 RepID=A0A8H4TWN3_9HYPO|nr:hypothetical protein FSARC_6806 [Fusarium sarcochroum]